MNFDRLRVGDKIEGAIVIGRRAIALPSGTWEVGVMSERNSSTDGSAQLATIATLYLMDIAGGRLHRGLSVTATKLSVRTSWRDEPCKVKGTAYWIHDRKRGINDEFCIRVDFQSGVVDQARGSDYVAWARRIKAANIGYSPEMPVVSVTRYTEYDYLRMTMSFDPSMAGIGLSAEKDRQYSDWNGDVALGKPAQRAFYQALQDWAPTFAHAVDRAFKGDGRLLPSDFGTPVLQQPVADEGEQ